MKNNEAILTLKKLNIDTYSEPVIYMHEDFHICEPEGFGAPARGKF